MDTRTSEQRSVLSYPPSQCDTSLTGRCALHDLAASIGSDVEQSQIISTARSSTAEQSLPMTGTPTSHSRSETWWFPTRPALLIAHRRTTPARLPCLLLTVRYTREAVLCHIQTRQASGHRHPLQARYMVRYFRIHICLYTTQDLHNHKVTGHCDGRPATHPCRLSDADDTTTQTEQ